jgi:hypothetical protein
VVHCHFRPRDLFVFLLISLPGLAIGGAGLVTFGALPLIIWIGLAGLFFGVIEIRVLCSHCPHYAEQEAFLGCWANHGAPKLWRYRAGPMSRTELLVFFAGLVAVWGYPLAGLIVGGSWSLLGLYAVTSAGFFIALNRLFCARCMNFACPLNAVGQRGREQFLRCNPPIGAFDR